MVFDRRNGRLRSLRVGGRVVVAVGVGLLGVGLGVLPAQAAPTSTVVYSVDGGATWSSDVTAAPGATVLTRVYYNNDTTGAIDGASVTAAIPSGFTLVPGSTTACLNPGTTDPTAPSSEMVCSAPLTDSAIWPDGQNLAVSPTAGLFGQPTTDTTGMLEMGRPRYLNLHQCSYSSPLFEDTVAFIVGDTPNPGDFDTGTNASNTADTSVACGAGVYPYPYQPVNSGVEALDLLGNRYVNLHQCGYSSPLFEDAVAFIVGDTPNPDDFDTGTNASNTADTSVTCGTGVYPYPYQPVNSGVGAIDLLDPTRGQGFIQFSMTAPVPAETTTYPQTAQLVGPGTGDPTSTGSITVDVLAIPLIDPVVGLSTAALAGMVTVGVVLVRRRRTTS